MTIAIGSSSSTASTADFISSAASHTFTISSTKGNTTTDPSSPPASHTADDQNYDVQQQMGVQHHNSGIQELDVQRGELSVDRQVIGTR